MEINWVFRRFNLTHISVFDNFFQFCHFYGNNYNSKNLHILISHMWACFIFQTELFPSSKVHRVLGVSKGRDRSHGTLLYRVLPDPHARNVWQNRKCFSVKEEMTPYFSIPDQTAKTKLIILRKMGLLKCRQVSLLNIVYGQFTNKSRNAKRRNGPKKAMKTFAIVLELSEFFTYMYQSRTLLLQVITDVSSQNSAESNLVKSTCISFMDDAFKTF